MGLEIFTEAFNDDKNAILTSMKNFYCHALKYKHNPNKQSKSWITSMTNAKDEINNTLKNSSNKERTFQNGISRDEYLKTFKKGREDAVDQENPQCKNQMDVFEMFPTMFDVIDENKFNSFIRDYAVHPYVIAYLNHEDASESLVRRVLNKIHKEKENN